MHKDKKKKKECENEYHSFLVNAIHVYCMVAVDFTVLNFIFPRLLFLTNEQYWEKVHATIS